MRWNYIRFRWCAALVVICGASFGAEPRPNILFAIADDWSWPHASIWDAPEIHTPHFDRVAREGILFELAFTAAPQCSPNRAAILTGRHIWQLQEAGTHGSIFPKTYPVFTDQLEASGYFIGYTGKPWAPGRWEEGGWDRNPAGPKFGDNLIEPPASGISNIDYAANFRDFMKARPADAPFFFWYGAREPHLRYEQGSGKRLGKNPDRVRVPKFLPNDPIVRNDMLDYFVEIEWFDRHLGAMLDQLEQLGELAHTLVIVTSDNGMPFPKAKANLYEYGTHVPLAMYWEGRIEPGRRSDALVSAIDLGATVLAAAGVAIPETMTGRSFLALLTDPDARGPRPFLATGRERHSHARFDNRGYPARALRTQEYLYIRNFKPDRWPAGDPDAYYDVDASPTKTLMQDRLERNDPLSVAAFGKRPAEELFDIRNDPECLVNLANHPDHERVRIQMDGVLSRLLAAQQDPRVLGTGDVFESYPRFGSFRPHLGGFIERGEYNPKYAPQP